MEFMLLLQVEVQENYFSIKSKEDVEKLNGFDGMIIEFWLILNIYKNFFLQKCLGKWFRVRVFV